jgi:hypothetical protein
MRMIITLAAVCMTVMAAWAADMPAPSNGIGYPSGSSSATTWP